MILRRRRRERKKWYCVCLA
jgi:hypothetical protein